MKKGRLTIKIYQHDWIPGFAALLNDGSIKKDSIAHIVLNLGSLLGIVKYGMIKKKELPYIVAECIMHEIIHALESWAEVEFSERKVNALIKKYQKRKP
jgi:hypothetical protein